MYIYIHIVFSRFFKLVNWKNVRLRFEYCPSAILRKDSFLDILCLDLFGVGLCNGLFTRKNTSASWQGVTHGWKCQPLVGWGGWNIRFVLQKQSTVAQYLPESISLPVAYYIPDILLMEEILHHLGCIKPCKQWDKQPINCCRISAINSMCIWRYLHLYLSDPASLLHWSA